MQLAYPKISLTGLLCSLQLRGCQRLTFYRYWQGIRRMSIKSKDRNVNTLIFTRNVSYMLILQTALGVKLNCCNDLGIVFAYDWSLIFKSIILFFSISKQWQTLTNAYMATLPWCSPTNVCFDGLSKDIVHVAELPFLERRLRLNDFRW